ncbi:MAG: hypothetical protein J2P23_14340, partial [Microlunatus sp.]|nr:hypothetical protein [Microlunatus sp.]
MRNVLGSLVARLVAPVSYLRLVFVLIGAAIALALGIAEFTVLSLIAGTGVPRWVLIMSGIVLIGSPLLIGVIPAVRQIEG